MIISKEIIGIDLGGTQVRSGILANEKLIKIVDSKIPSLGSVEEVLQCIYNLVDRLVSEDTGAIGIGVPSVVDIEKGIVFDVQNIPSWKNVPLKKLMEERYHVQVLVNNDANCFALGEKYFGKGKEFHSMIGLTIGTGLGAGIIIHNKLYAGINCGAGEFGNVNYLDHDFEYYASGQFFKNCYQTTGEEIFRKANQEDPFAIKVLEEFGAHLGNAIKMILYTYAPQQIILGGSVSKSYSFFQEKMWERIRTYVYSNTLHQFSLEISNLENSGVLGAAALYFDQS